MKTKKPKIYVAGPYTSGDVAINVRNAISMANQLADLGCAPYVPHFTHFWHMHFPRSYEFWLEHDNEFLPLCDGLIRLAGRSNGADKEMDLAKALGIPVFLELEALIEHFNLHI